jgi:hypothetical protein
VWAGGGASAGQSPRPLLLSPGRRRERRDRPHPALAEGLGRVDAGHRRQAGPHCRRSRGRARRWGSRRNPAVPQPNWRLGAGHPGCGGGLRRPVATRCRTTCHHPEHRGIPRRHGDPADPGAADPDDSGADVAPSRRAGRGSARPPRLRAPRGRRGRDGVCRCPHRRARGRERRGVQPSSRSGPATAAAGRARIRRIRLGAPADTRRRLLSDRHRARDPANRPRRLAAAHRWGRGTAIRIEPGGAPADADGGGRYHPQLRQQSRGRGLHRVEPLAWGVDARCVVPRRSSRLRRPDSEHLP